MLSRKRGMTWLGPQMRIPGAPTMDTGGEEGRALREERRREGALCRPIRGLRGFEYWTTNHVQVLTESPGTKLELWPGQRRIAERIVRGHWALILKGRQLGATWVVCAYLLWRLMFMAIYTILVVSQERMYAEEIIDRVRFMWERLPEWCKRVAVKDKTQRLRFEGRGYRTEIISLAGSKKTGRSLTGDCVVFDEAGTIPAFGPSYAASFPVIERRKGQFIVMGTSQGPGDAFHGLWTSTYGTHGELLDKRGRSKATRFYPLFIRWSEVLGRDRKWYDEQKRELDLISPVEIKREHPNDPQEAWEYGVGRIFPEFTEDNIGDLSILSSDFNRYRAIDWGSSLSAWVVLFVAYREQRYPGLIVSPNCPNTIRELLNYRLDPDTQEPIKKDDHAIDALRYLVTTYRMTGLVYVYREIYIIDSLARGYGPMEEIAEVHRASGWRETFEDERAMTPGVLWTPTAEGELFAGGVADRSLGKMIHLYGEHQIPLQPAAPLSMWWRGKEKTDKPKGEKIEGIRHLKALIRGTREMLPYVEVSRLPGSPRFAGAHVSEPLHVRRARFIAGLKRNGRQKKRS